MEQFLNQLMKALSDIGFVTKKTGWGLEADDIRLQVEHADDAPNGYERVLFMGSRLSISPSGKIPNLEKAIGLACIHIAREKARRKKWSRISNIQSKGKDATINEHPGGWVLSVKFKDQLTATAALDLLMEHGMVDPAE